jgi:hypothetical protein
VLIVAAGMYRSGSTLQYQIAGELSAPEGKILGYGLKGKIEKIQKNYKEKDRYYVVKKHGYLPWINTTFDPKYVRILYSYREIKDVVVSWHQKRGDLNLDGDWQKPLTAFVKKLIVNQQWTKEPNVLVSRYEDFRNNIESEIVRIANFTGLIHSPERYAEIAQKLSVEGQKKFIESFDFDNRGIGSGRNRYDPKTQIHKNHLAGGEVGKWKSVLTPEQSKYIDELINNPQLATAV